MRLSVTIKSITRRRTHGRYRVSATSQCSARPLGPGTRKASRSASPRGSAWPTYPTERHVQEKAEPFFDQSVQASSRAILLETRNVLSQAAPQFASLRTVGVPKLGDLQSRLDQHEAIIEFYGYNDYYFVFVMTRDGVAALANGNTFLIDQNARLYLRAQAREIGLHNCSPFRRVCLRTFVPSGGSWIENRDIEPACCLPEIAVQCRDR